MLASAFAFRDQAGNIIVIIAECVVTIIMTEWLHHSLVIAQCVAGKELKSQSESSRLRGIYGRVSFIYPGPWRRIISIYTGDWRGF